MSSGRQVSADRAASSGELMLAMPGDGEVKNVKLVVDGKFRLSMTGFSASVMCVEVFGLMMRMRTGAAILSAAKAASRCAL